MDPSLRSPTADDADAKAAFRKPSSDAANRKYRRRSPVSGSSSSDGSPKREHCSSPIFSKVNDSRISDYQEKRKDGGRELDRDYGQNQYSRGGDSHRHSNRQSSRSSRDYNRHDDDVRHDRRGDEEERNYRRSSHRSDRESRDGTYSGSLQLEDQNRSRDNGKNVDRYPYDKHGVAGYRSKDKERESSYLEHKKYREKDLSGRTGAGRRHSNVDSEGIRSSEQDRHIRDRDIRDGRRDYYRSSGDYRNDHIPFHDEYRGRRRDSISARDSSANRLKEAQKSHSKEIGQKHAREDKDTNDGGESNWDKGRYDKASGKQFEEGGREESLSKKPKCFSLDASNGDGKDGGEKQSSNAKQSPILSKMASEPSLANSTGSGNDVDAAKVAAMKAAELVNKNLTTVGCMSTEEKKKLLWGKKKTTTVEEPGHRWDATLFPDRERQEKFNKLMGVKGLEHNINDQDDGEVLRAEKQKELQLDLEKQYTAGLRRRDGRTVGLGL